MYWPWLAVGLVAGVEAQYKIGSTSEIKSSARSLAFDLIKFYNGNESGQIPGILPGPPPAGPYYWWEGGAMMGTYIDYWRWTGDETYNSLVMEGMLHQVGENNNYMPKNHTLSMGNDDQGFWGMSAMLAAENQFPDPPADKPQWLALAQGVWNTQADPTRHDDKCNGGMRWQIPITNPGYNYKNTIANGIFFNMGARLARYTGNSTYAERAEQIFDWMWDVGYIDHKNWHAYDGAHVESNCTDLNKATFSYNAGVLTQGAAYMYNYTKGSEKWTNRLDSLVNATLSNFFRTGVMVEVACERQDGKSTCTPDMLSFKGYVHRWLATITQVAPYKKDVIMPLLRKSTEAAVKQCTGGESGRQCGFYWNYGRFVDPGADKTSGAGEAMNVLAAVSSLLIGEAPAPVTNGTGGTSKGDPNAGGRDNTGKKPIQPITTADKAGAGVLTVLILGSTVGMFVWMCGFD